MVGTEAVSGAIGLLTQFRYVVALGVLGVLGYWTVERSVGEDSDPTLRWSGSSDTGAFSVLMSGTTAVLVLALVGVLALFPEIRAGNPVLLFALLGIVGVHWWFEKEERE